MSYLAEEGYQDWRLLYRYTRSNFVWPHIFKDWRKQWLINENIRDRYMMMADASFPMMDSTGSKRPEDFYDSLHETKFKHTSSCELPYGGIGTRKILHINSPPISNPIGLECGRCGKQGCSTKTLTLPISYPILKIVVSVGLVEDRATYISGFDLIHGANISDTQFGYRIPGKQVTLDLHGQTLKGFQVKSSSRGIHAIRLVKINEKTGFSKWAGHAEHFDVLSTYSITAIRCIAAISADFEVS